VSWLFKSFILLYLKRLLYNAIYLSYIECSIILQSVFHAIIVITITLQRDRCSRWRHLSCAQSHTCYITRIYDNQSLTSSHYIVYQKLVFHTPRQAASRACG